MNRHAIRSALRRGTPSSTTARALSLPISTTTPTSFFSTTTSRPTDEKSSSNNNNNNSGSSKPRSQNAAVERLTQLNNNNNRHNSAPRREALDSIPGLSSSPRGGGGSGGTGFRRGSGIIDARSLRVSPEAGASNAASSSSSAPRVLNLRSLRGGLSGRVPFGRGGGIGAGRAAAAAGGGEGGFARPRLGFGAGAGGPQRGGFRGRFGGAGGGFGDRSSRGGAGRFGARGGGRGRGRGRGGRGGQRDPKATKEVDSGHGKLVWSAEEKALIDRLEQGEMVPFDPKLTLDSLSGYGAALATDAPIGQVESALRAMRLMTGGMAFNAESGVTADVKAVIERYKQKKPIFVHSKEEKAWIESSQPRLRLVGPNAETKKAIVDTAILGQYKGSTFAEVGDVKATMANYHARTFTYMASDSQKFMDKVLSLLPAQGGGKPAAQARKP